jgi:tRNA U54 and U55 pseudouridine synthase Pus10
MQLTERCDVWRFVGAYDGGKALQAVYTRVPCLRVPVSSFDKVATALAARDTGATEGFHVGGRQSTDVFLLPNSYPIQIEDELRRGRRTGITGTVQAYRYQINGIRDYETFGYQDTTAVFCTLTQ